MPNIIPTPADLQVETATLTTTDATAATLWSKDIPTNYVGLVRVMITGRKSDGSARASYQRAATVYRASSSAALGGSVLTIGTDYESDSSWDATLDLSSNTLRLRVTGVASTSIAWSARVELLPA